MTANETRRRALDSPSNGKARATGNDEPKAAIVRELVLVTLPLTAAIVIDAAKGSDRTDLPGV
ncbi:MAG: hypothetical protein GY939_24655 [Actinomycetia bacterium]|nr:hypothetical protein [Actinomycetes bacterium]